MNQRLKLYTFDNYYSWVIMVWKLESRQILGSWSWNRQRAPLEVSRIRYRLIFFYKVIHHLVAIPYSSWHQNQTQIQIHSGTYRHQKTATNTECTFKFLLMNPSDWFIAKGTGSFRPESRSPPESFRPE
jgi:hypothetical protein